MRTGRNKWLMMSLVGILSGMLFSLEGADVKDKNMMLNGGFEELDSKNNAVSWSFGCSLPKGKAEITTGTVYSGKNSLHLRSESINEKSDSTKTGAISASSEMLPLPPEGTKLECSVCIKLKDVKSPGSYHKTRFTVHFFDKDRKRIKHHDLVCLDGTLDWRIFKQSLTVPSGAAFMQIACSLTNCTGEAWFDDVMVTVDGESARKVTERRNSMSALPMDCPILIPEPWQIKFASYSFSVEKVFFETPNGDSRANLALLDVLKEYNLAADKMQKDKSYDATALLILTGDKQDKDLAGIFEKDFRGRTWNELGEQGYFLSVKEIGRKEESSVGGEMIKGGKKIVCIGANTEQGRFYGIQTLRQLLKAGKGKELRAVNIVDKPTLSRRGAIVGLQWFSQRKEAIERIRQMKMNLVYHQGSFLNLKLGCDQKTKKTFWREPFTSQELEMLREYLELCRRNFIEVYISFAPRGLPPTCYSSDEDINILVGKMEALYKVGVRNLGISFDDLQNIEQNKVICEADIKKFGDDFGAAHLYFVQNVYDRLKKKCPELNFMVLPYVYGSYVNIPEKDMQYLKTLGKLSQDIKTWVVCLYTYDGVKKTPAIAGRKPFIWDNYYTTGDLPAFPAPIDRARELSDENITGYIFLPATPKQEDASKISWLNAADYMWSPQRYNAEKSYKTAIAYVAGSAEAAELLKEYSEFSLKIDDYKFPTENRETRLAFLEKTMDQLNTFDPKLKILEPKLATAMRSDTGKYRKDLQRIIDNLKQRPYPAIIYPQKGFVPTNENALKDFIPLSKNVKSIEATEAWLTYDPNKLYLKVLCREPCLERLVTQRNNRDSNVFQDDSIEIFIMPDQENASGDFTYYHIVINAIGTVYDAKHVHHRFNYLHEQYKDWNPELDITTSKEKNTWILNLAIPFSALGMASPQPGRRIFMNLCRNRMTGGKGELSCYALLLKGKYHDPWSFWPVEFK
ncbi:MAG: hypothetical protein A2017_13150 [Lentisphaerae bacterium GWF2_44_16]|nr:MAG: hypothetical protein A2017_13150 [Lentisphaerae bacterium GWF2_44_16]